jgi:anthranilate synthase component 1
VFTGGWVGYAGYDTVRYVYSSKLPFESAPEDDRQLPDIHLALYNDVMVFDQVGGALGRAALPLVHTPHRCSGQARRGVEVAGGFGELRAELVLP